ncbi:MAG: sulfurtransferase [Armatimonadetes bacterium]|nr:sulfurtransferase [Armatimonadota bacterium]
MTNVPEISVLELNGILDSAVRPILLDVRNADELDICKLPYDFHIPLAELPERYTELDPTADIVVYCRSGGRSGKATEFLLGQGFAQVRNMTGGVLAWGKEIDESMTAY